MKYLSDSERETIQLKDLFWNKDFLENINSPLMWKLKADELKTAAEVIRESIKSKELEVTKLIDEGLEDVVITLSIYNVYLLLIGFTVENLLKGIFVSKNRIEINEKGKLNPKMDHDLIRLASTNNIEFDKDEIDMLEKLTRYIVWEGRYPTPINEKEFASPRTKENIKKWPGTFVPSIDEPIIERIVGKLYNHINQLG